MEFLSQTQTKVLPEIEKIFEVLPQIGITKPVPILLMKTQQNDLDWSGLCQNSEFTEADEIVIDAELFSPSKIPEVDEDWILSVYLHEFTHRLLNTKNGHDLIFLL